MNSDEAYQQECEHIEFLSTEWDDKLHALHQELERTKREYIETIERMQMMINEIDNLRNSPWQ